MEDELWHFTSDFNELPAKDVLKNILRDDKKNYERAESELGEDIDLLDEAIILYIESLQAAYRLIEEWKDNPSNQAAMAMLTSTINYIFLARHGILLGYYPEVRDLLRSCLERISRTYVFFFDDEMARKFLAGEQIWQKEVDSKLSKLEEDPDKSAELFSNLRKYYGFMSNAVHPNLESFEARLGDKNLSKRVGLEYIFGGLMSSKRGHITIIRLIQTVLSALKIIQVIIHEESGAWDKEYQRISKKCDELIRNL
jgi:hypothetical protein